MPSQIELYNLALLRVGQGKTLESLTEDSQAADVLNLVYPLAVDIVLAEGPWPFAQRRAALVPLGPGPAGWARQYALPADCLVPGELWAGTRPTRPDEAIPYEVVALQDEDGEPLGSALNADRDGATLLYTARVRNPELYPPLFADALAWKLASMAAAPLTGDPSRSDQAEQRYRLALAGALRDALTTGHEARPRPNRVIASRR